MEDNGLGSSMVFGCQDGQSNSKSATASCLVLTRGNMAILLREICSIVFASFFFLAPASALSTDCLKISDEEFQALPEEQLYKFPVIDCAAKILPKGKKDPFFRRVLIFSIEGALYDLKYYLAIPRGEENVTLTTAIKQFQKDIGAVPTGILLMGESKALNEKQNLISYLSARVKPGGNTHIFFLGDFGTVEGTWAFEDEFGKEPIQTSKMICRKESMECLDITASIDDERNLWLMTGGYHITKWTDDEVVAENDIPKCVAYTLTINLQKKEAYLFRRGKGNTEKCRSIGVKAQILRLEPGWEVERRYYRSRFQQALSAYNPEYSKYLKLFYGDMEPRK